MADNSCASGLETAMECSPLHVEGFCEPLCRTPDGLLTAGADGKLMKVVTKPGMPAERAWAHRLCDRDALGAVAVSPDGAWLATGQETAAGFSVWVCGLDCQGGHRPAALPRLAARFTLPVRHLAWHGPLLGIATDDGKLCLWDREADTSGDSRRPRRRDLPVGGGGGVRGLAFDPRGELLAAALSSGALAVFGLRDGKERHRAQLWPKAVPGSERLLLAWSPEGEALALPGEPTPRLAARSGWATTALDGGHRLPVTAAAWGKLLATASEDAVCMWQPPQLVLTCRPQQQPYSLLWGGHDFLTIGTVAGSWARLTPPAQQLPAAAPQVASGTEGGEPDHTSSGVGSIEEIAVEATAATIDSKGPDEQSKAAVVEAPVPVEQEPFQPGATRKDSRRCYLAWNDHGMLKFSVASSASGDDKSRRRSRSSRSSISSISEPTSWAGMGRVVVDYSRERGPTSVREFQAPSALVFGALGPGICALAAAGRGRRPAQLTVHLAKPWNRDRTSFQHELPVGETVEALAVSRHFVAAFTSPYRFLRVHTLTGLPISVLSLSGDVVCLAASDDLLLCVTHAPGPRRPEPCLEYALFGVTARERLAAGSLPLSPSSRLRWIGFSAEAMPLMLDSAGALRGLALSGGQPLLAPGAGEWLPLAELPEGGSRLWPVRAEAGALHCVELSEPGAEPRVGPLQKLQELRFCLPLGIEEAVAEKMLRGLLAEHLNFAREAGILPKAAGKSLKRKLGLPDQPALRPRV